MPDKEMLAVVLIEMALPKPDFIAITDDGVSYRALWINESAINVSWAADGHGKAAVSLYDGKTGARLIASELAKMAGCNERTAE